MEHWIKNVQDRPTAPNILNTISLFLRDLMERTEGKDKFHLRVSIHLLNIIEREIEISSGQDQDEQVELAKLLGTEGSLKELNTLLAQKIRDGSIDYQDEKVFELVLEILEAKLRIVNPEYLKA